MGKPEAALAFRASQVHLVRLPSAEHVPINPSAFMLHTLTSFPFRDFSGPQSEKDHESGNEKTRALGLCD